MVWRSCSCDPSDHLQESLGPRGPKSQKKSLRKSLFWGVCKKVPENTRKSQKIPQIRPFWVFFLLFRGIFYFFGFFRGLSRGLAILGSEGPETPVNGRSGRKVVEILEIFFRRQNFIHHRHWRRKLLRTL